MNWLGLLWLIVPLVLLLQVERWIHRHLQGVMLLLTGDPDMVVILYALPLLPGIVLHELSHALAALLLGVRVGRISIGPKRVGERIQLGFVPVERTDAVRATLIGLAPLLLGSLVILVIGYAVFGVGAVQAALAAGDWQGLWEGLGGMLRAPDTWVWAYAVFCISNTMLPSETDRQAWRPVIVYLLLAVALTWLSGLGPALAIELADPIGAALRWLGLMCAFTLLVDLPFALFVALAEKGLGRARGLRVEY